MDDATKSDVQIWEKEVDQHVAQNKNIKINIMIDYVVVWGSKFRCNTCYIEGTEDFKNI